MKLQDLSLKEFLEKTASNEPVPGGGSIAALTGAISASLCGMLAGLTVGKKKYADVEKKMKAAVKEADRFRTEFINDIDRDSDAYNLVVEAFKLPKSTDEEKEMRSKKIQDAMKVAATVPMEVAERAYDMLELTVNTTKEGNSNAVTDGLVSVMSCRNAILGSILNVRINLSSIKDETFVQKLAERCDLLESKAIEQERELYHLVKKQL